MVLRMFCKDDLRRPISPLLLFKHIFKSSRSSHIKFNELNGKGVSFINCLFFGCPSDCKVVPSDLCSSKRPSSSLELILSISPPHKAPLATGWVEEDQKARPPFTTKIKKN